MFSIRNLNVTHPGRKVIAGLHLSAPAPGSLALIGPGGAGKSSLLRAVVGKSDIKGNMLVSGDITLCGQPTQALGEEIGWYEQWRHEADMPSAKRSTRLSDG